MEISEYDFKGAVLEKKQMVIKDSLLTSTTAYTISLPTPGDTNFQTDIDNLLEYKAHTGDTGTDGYVTNMEYDAIGRPTKVTYPKDVNDARKELKPKYNKAGALYSVLFDSTEYVKEIAYNAKGQRLLLALGNGAMTRYAYSNTNFRLLRMCTEKYTYTHVGTEHKFAYDSVTDTRKQDLAYQYDLKGNIKSIKTTLDNSGYTENYGGVSVANDDELTRKFKYDAINRLIEAIGREAKTNGAGNVWDQPTKTNSPVNASGMRQYKRTYAYDKMGNIGEIQHLSGTNSFTRNFNYRTGLNQLSTIDDNQAVPTVFTSYTHDANGNQTQLNTERFLEWDYADQLKLFKIDNGTATKWAQYRYSGGQRIKKVSSVAGGNYTTTIYIDGIFEYQFLKRGSNTYERNYSHIMDDSKRIAQVRAGSAQEDIGDSVFYVVDDHLGTSTLRLKSDATLIDRQECYPFGETSLRTFDYKRYQYVGKERDDESGLYYYGARYYSAWTCRFIGVDPLARDYPQLTPYNYASNKPINSLDVDGMQNPDEPKVPESQQPHQYEQSADSNRPHFTNESDLHGGNEIILSRSTRSDTNTGVIIKMYNKNGKEIKINWFGVRAKRIEKYLTVENIQIYNQSQREISDSEKEEIQKHVKNSIEELWSTNNFPGGVLDGNSKELSLFGRTWEWKTVPNDDGSISRIMTKTKDARGGGQITLERKVTRTIYVKTSVERTTWVDSKEQISTDHPLMVLIPTDKTNANGLTPGGGGSDVFFIAINSRMNNKSIAHEYGHASGAMHRWGNIIELMSGGDEVMAIRHSVVI